LYPSILDAQRKSTSSLPQIGAADVQWRANLDLRFVRRENRTLLAAKSHRGPLQVQKALYPDGSGICHVTVLHPPGGVAGGDALAIAARLDPGSRVSMTTCGATKWYRCPRVESEHRARDDSRAGVTTLPGVLLARYLGHSSQDAMQWFTSIVAGAAAGVARRDGYCPRLWAC
jgi:urease accessory protein UreH